MTVDPETATQVKLLTLLNVSAVKRPRDRDLPGGHRSPSVRDQSVAQGSDAGEQPEKKRKSVIWGGEIGPSGSQFNKGGKGKGKGKAKGEANGKSAVIGKGAVIEEVQSGSEEELAVDEEESDNESQASTSADLFNLHFGAEPSALTPESVKAAEANQWKSERKTLKGFGRAVEITPEGAVASGDVKTRITPSLLPAIKEASSSNPLLSTSLSHLGSYKDFYLHSLDGEADGSEIQLMSEHKEAMRKAVAIHALNHVLKTRRKIIRNNEKLAHAAAAENPTSVPEPPRDQSFTRPKVLFLLPTRALALHYLKNHLSPLAPAGTQLENQRPFTTSFSLPEDEQDPLASSSAASEFPIDHLANFRGNTDDNFRFGLKLTRKAWRVVMMPANEAKLMECDILFTSPLGFKMTSEREDSTDLLSSLEITVVDGADVMQMQNWEHVQFIFNNINKIPASPHGCDFSRVKPWYLESQAQYLRQTIILSRYDTPESRGLFNRHCRNLQGKIRLEKTDFGGVMDRVRPGVKQVFERIDLEGPKGMEGEAAVDEVEKRLTFFTENTLPALLRAAISRQNTLIVVPSYFDFVRLTNHLRKEDKVSFAAISEYSSGSEISRARTLFFKGKKAFLIVTERFHFYRRYKLRGAKTIVFYSLPDHAQFYSEFMDTPFQVSKNKSGEEVDVDEAEVSSRVLFSRFDVLKLERVIGTENARKLLKSGDGRFEFI
ncbi:U3 small nucleolar RNA-associated protein 25 [Cryptococcus wingfieldii CBS 7118]|uniref:U3 small nucleolar RNA-associated protein 25 n=1 Tax=Cryptococcus wingfieldii CBS 7118 TaxID=1295528 RepID=A0A1E3IQH0_9TREE|nr:U3 small nucleolar RNA-associated protein 25 [Cryptococcus wingfieldii CBS 7118]ODN90832.1 U3 small nucleolar RNA-associated protein 25 [Cryptococcus wingfieldii CBS 7118]